MKADLAERRMLPTTRAWHTVGLLSLVVVSVWLFWESHGTSDIELWLRWMQEVLSVGPRRGYAQIHADYPPGSSFTLWLVAKLALASGHDTHAVLKLALFGFLLVTVAILFAASRRPGLAAFAYGSLALSSLSLMYLDIFTAPFVIAAVWAARAGREPLMIGLLAGACVMKWQPLFVMPFGLMYVFLQRPTMARSIWRRKVIVTGGILAGLASLVLLAYGVGPVFDALRRASRHNDLSDFGANPLWILTWWLERTSADSGLVSIRPASRPLLRVLSLVTLLAYGEVMRRYWRANDRTPSAFLRFSLVGYLVYFMCSAGVHENHLFLAGVLSISLAWQASRWAWVAVVIGIAANLNLVAFYGWRGAGAARLIHGVDVTVSVACAISVAIACIAWVLVTCKGETAQHDLRQVMRSGSIAPD